MKKLYTLAALALLGASASAQTLYVKGEGQIKGTDTYLSWDLGVDYALEQVNGEYTLELLNTSAIKISTVKSENVEKGWDLYNEGAYQPVNKGTYSEDCLGNPVPLEIGGDNIAMPWGGDYKIVIAGDLSTVTLTTDTPKPEGFTKIYLRGEMNGWGVEDTWEMTTEDGVLYWFDCTGETVIPNGTQWKIADKDWGKMNFSAGAEIIPIDEYILWNYNGDNGVMAAEDDVYEGTILLNLYYGPGSSNPVIVFPEIVEHVAPEYEDAGVESVVVDSNAPAVYYNLQGVKVVNPANGLYIVRQGNKASKVLVK